MHCHFRPTSKPKTFYFGVPKAVTFWLWTLQIEVRPRITYRSDLKLHEKHTISQRCDTVMFFDGFWCILADLSDYLSEFSNLIFLQV